MTQEPTLRRSITLLVGLLVLGCADSENGAPADSAATEQALPSGHVPVGQSATGGGQEAALTVVVLETMNAGGYTYARVDAEGTEAWTAGPEAQLAVGDTLLLSGASPMENFTSNTLNRTFDLIYFVGAFQKTGGELAVNAAPTDQLAPITGGIQGVVGQVFTGGGYAYVQVAVEGDSIWLAGPMAKVSVGETVAWQGGTTMYSFESKSLDRTFEEILFVERISVVR